MTANRRIAAPPELRRLPAASGFTLLEVLVALGIIIGALGGIAALLPAFGSRLAEAVQIDRAGTMIANARAEVFNRGLTSYVLWQQASGTTADTRAIVFGEGLTLSGTALSPAIATTGAANVIALAGTAALLARINPMTGFHLRDVVETTVTGSNVLTGTGYVPGICFGCMLSSTVRLSGSEPGASVRMTTVVFRKPSPEVRSFILTQTGSGSTVLVSGSGDAAALVRRQFLPGCSWVLAVGVGEPRWINIASSWTAYASGQTTGAGTGSSFVSLSGTDWLGLVSGSSLQVFGFEGILRVDEQFVNLE